MYYANKYLMHYGVKGMKWGVRHDPERKGRKRKKKMSTRTKVLIGVAAVAAVAALSIAGRQAYINYGRLHADNIIKAGQTLKRVTYQPEGVKSGDMAYFADNKADAEKYKAMFGGGGFAEAKKSVEAKVVKDMKIAGLDTGKREFEKLYNTDSNFKKVIDENYKGIHALDFFGNKDSIDSKWRNFNTYGLLRKADGSKNPGADVFVDALKQKGYNGVADINDRKYSGFKTKAHILFDYKNSISDIKVSQLNDVDIRNARKYTANRELVKEITSPKYLAATSAGAAFIASGSYMEEQENAKNRKK